MSVRSSHILAVLIGFATIVCGPAAHSEPMMPFGSAGTYRLAPSAVTGFPRLYQSVKTASCLDTNVCEMGFDRVKDNHVLHATHLNCFAVPTVTNPNVVEQVVISLFSFASLKPPVLATVDRFVPRSDDVQPFRFSVNETISTYFQERARPRVSVATGLNLDANISFGCKLTGTLLKL